MRGYTAFLQKEITEHLRTYRLFILLTVFFIFGMMSPLAAKLLPQILSSAMPEGVTITLPDPSAVDSWTQFFKNISQMGLIITVILFSGVLGTELNRGTLINMLTKGLSRNAVILSKFTGIAFIWTISYALAFVVCWGYTVYLFPGETLVNLGFSVFCLWLFGIFLLASLMFAASLTKSNYAALLIVCILVGTLFILNIFPNLQGYNPVALISQNVAIIQGSVSVSELLHSMLITLAAVATLISASILILRKRLI